jgi:hypothetical protein
MSGALEAALEDRNRWIRLFNRLDAAVSRHRKAKDPEGRSFKTWADDTDDALHAAHDRILKDAATPPALSCGGDEDVCQGCHGTGLHTFDPPVGDHAANQTEPCPSCGGDSR